MAGYIVLFGEVGDQSSYRPVGLYSCLATARRMIADWIAEQGVRLPSDIIIREMDVDGDIEDRTLLDGGVEPLSIARPGGPLLARAFVLS